MFKRSLARAACFILIFSLVLSTTASAAVRDEFIRTDPIDNTYIGRPNIEPLLDGIRFPDLPPDPSLQEAVARGAAMGVFMPDGGTFQPNQVLTRYQAITYALRVAGLSEDARARTANVITLLPDNAPLTLVRIFTYLQQAQASGLITAAQFNQSVAFVTPPPPLEEGELPPPPPEPYHTLNASREEIAFWLFTAMEAADGDIFDAPANQPGPSIYTFTDWGQIDPRYADAIDALTRLNVIPRQPTFSPRAPMTRIQMAAMIRNLDSLHIDLLELERFTGTVADIAHEQHTDTLGTTQWQFTFIRRADARVDVLQSTSPFDLNFQNAPLDAVVFRNGVISGMDGLQIGDQIEYIVHPEYGTVWYVRVVEAQNEQTFLGQLRLIDIEEGQMAFTAPDGRIHTFNMKYGLYGIDAMGVPFVRMGHQVRPVDTLPMGSFFYVTLLNNIILAIEFVGQPTLIPEIRGIVIENNPLLGFLTILDENRVERSFNYVPGTLRVQRRDFYDMRDTVGGIHELFPDLHFNPLIVEMDAIVPGDIVSFRVADDDPLRIVHLSAAAQTTTRYGRIREFRPRVGYHEMMLEFNNGRTAWFTVADGVLVLENGRPVAVNQIQIGDWVRVYVTQALLAPGVMMESVLEVAIDGGGHHINTLVKGQLATFNAAQNQLEIINAEELTPNGWSNHQMRRRFNIGAADTRYYLDGQQVTLSTLARRLQRGDGTVYLALENHFAGERVNIVSIRSGRDELLRPETVLSANDGNFNLMGIPGTLRTDPGTIVVRNGRRVEPHHISTHDWVQVSLNGHNLAAIVEIGQAPSVRGVQIIRGRVQRVVPQQNFRVESIVSFDGFGWNFSPIEREFTIDHNTIFVMDDGFTTINQFIGFTEETVIGQMFTVVVEESGRAAWVIDAPWPNPIPMTPTAPGHLSIRGTIFETGDDSFELREVTVFNPFTGAWVPNSLVNATASITTAINTIIIDRDRVVSAESLQPGQQVRILTAMPRVPAEIIAGMDADALIVLVEG